jgi:hypothetical protein
MKIDQNLRLVFFTKKFFFSFSGKISSRSRSYGGGRHDDVDDDDFVDSVGDQGQMLWNFLCL